MPGFKKWDSVEYLLDNFEQITAELDSTISRELFKIISSLDSKNGRLTPQSLGKAFQDIDRIFAVEFKGRDYKSQLEKMHNLIEVITDANIEINKNVNDIDLTQDELKSSANLEVHKENIVTGLSEAGIRQNVIIPIKQMVNAAVVQGKGTTALIHEFEQLFENGNNAQLTDIRGRSLKSYSSQIANDVTNAANGQIQIYLRDTYNLKRFRYIGNTIKDSRPFCKHMIDNESFPMTIEYLEPILKEYVGNKTKIRVGTNKNGTPKMVPKGGGMYGQTNTRNFPTVVGGYNCRHRFFFVR